MQSKTIARALAVAGGVLAWGTTLPAQDNAAAQQTPAVKVLDAQPAQPEPSQEPVVSQVRIVRLSQARGVVQMDRNTGRGFEAAFTNIPVIRGARLRTGDGVAEVEFEDNSSMRLAPNTEVRFDELGRLASGVTKTTVSVVKGLIYVGLEKTKGNEFSLIDGQAHVALLPGAHMRLNAEETQAQLAVFDGAAQVQIGGTSTMLTKKQTVVLNPSLQTVSSVAKGTEEDDWDAWDKKEIAYHRQKASFAGSGGSGLYGANDLGYYGSFVDMPGCGSMWRPYFASAAWDPFASGIWAWYPSAGYSWVSPYPWGWLPFHSGSWASCGSAGWGWRPGSSWYGLGNVQALRLANHPLPHPVPSAPARNAATLVPVNMKQLSSSGPSQGEAFAFRKDSAGMGVPRGAFGNLHGVSGTVARTGMATRTVPENSFIGTPVSEHQLGGAAFGRSANTPGGVRTGASPGLSASRSTSMGQQGGSMSGGMRGGSMGAPSAPAASGGSHK